jgi:glycolate oxidase iron-sulfur subunit
MHLVDQARAHITETYRRPLADGLLRKLLVKVLPRPNLFRYAMLLALIGKPFGPLLRATGLHRLSAILSLAPWKLPSSLPEQGKVSPAQGPRRGRVALLRGCVAPVLSPQINEAAERVLVRNGLEVVHVAGEGCCGSLAHHMGVEKDALAQARANIDAWTAEIAHGGLDAILITASGCGTTVKDYGYMFRTDPAYAEKAARVSALARDISEYLADLDLVPPAPSGRPLKVAYHGACSLQHGQKIDREPKALLARAGYLVTDIPEGHLCCGSAGTYNMLQPELATALRDRKVANIAQVAPDVIAAGNIGCITQIAHGTSTPVVHPVELLDWASGGPRPAGLGG